MKKILDLKTSAKLVLAFGIVSILLAFVGINALINLSNMNDAVDDMYDVRLISVHQASNMQLTYQRLRSIVYYMQLTNTRQEKQSYLDQARELMDELGAQLAAYNRKFTIDRHEELYKEALAAWETYRVLAEDILDRGLELDSAEFEEAMSGELGTAREVFDSSLQALIDFNLENAEEADRQADEQYKYVRNVTIAVVVFSFAVSIGLGVFISQLIARPLKKVSELVDQVAQGDLRNTIEMDRKDEVGQLARSVNHMVHNLREVVGNILSSAESVAAAAQQISASTEEIASGNANQANDAMRINELFKELSKSIEMVARNAENTAELAKQNKAIAENGGKVVLSSIEGMNRVNEHMSRLEEDSNKIGEIIEVIDDIADQTNLLALNAAIEAARAGDQGRGFAVVADEVRKLAERSGQATKEITAIIKGMQENTRLSVAAVTEGVASSHNTGEAFNQIIQVVNEAVDRMDEIAAASKKQATQAMEVLSAVDNITATTEEAAASSQETASTAQSLAHLADELNNAVSIFRIS